MKKLELNPLVLDKEVVARLDEEQMKWIIGGRDYANYPSDQGHCMNASCCSDNCPQSTCPTQSG